MSIKQYNTAGTFATIVDAQPTANRTITIPDISGTLALVDSQAFTGTPTAPTATAGTNTTQLATTAYVDGKMVLRTSVASTSGTSIDFTGIPTWAKRVTVMFNGVSTNGISVKNIQLGAGSIDTSGYVGRIFSVATNTLSITTGINIDDGGGGAADAKTGVITLVYISGNTWVATGLIDDDLSSVTYRVTYKKTLSGILDRVRLTTVNGTDIFDAGSINIMYEG